MVDDDEPRVDPEDEDTERTRRPLRVALPAFLTEEDIGLGDAVKRVTYAAGLVDNFGVAVAAVEPGSPAEQARLEQGDVILSLDGEPVGGVDDLVRLLNGERIGRFVELVLLRKGEMRNVTITPVERRTKAA